MNLKAQLIPTIGIKGGLNSSLIAGADASDRLSGLVGGLFVTLPLPATPISLQTEVLYAQYGSKLRDGTIELDYLQVPLLAKFVPDISSGLVQFWFEFGPYASFNLSKEYSTGSGSETVDISELINDSDYGAIVGAGFDINRFIFGFRYTSGLTDLFDESISDGEVNGSLQVTIGYSLF